MRKVKKQKSYEILSQAFAAKKRQSKGFSLRLIAQKLQISHSYLSRVFQGKKSLPSHHLSALCSILEIDEMNRLLLEKALIGEASKRRGLDLNDSLSNQSVGLAEIEDFDHIKDKDFTLYDQWYLIPLMDLSTCKGFRTDPQWIAKKLGISSEQAIEALEKLVVEGYLKKTATGIKKAHRKIRVPTVKSKPKVRTYHKEMILKALFELENKTDEESFQKRLISGICVAVNPQNLPKARQMIQAAMHEVAAVLAEGPCTELYHLNTQLFTLLKK